MANGIDRQVTAGVRDFLRGARTVSSASGWLSTFPNLAFHMMITFYLLLIIMAVIMGPEKESPKLMFFVVLWHLFAFPTWLARGLMLKICRAPLGMLLCFLVILILLFLLQQQLITAPHTITKWTQEAFVEIGRQAR
jgi:hypothetical protein